MVLDVFVREEADRLSISECCTIVVVVLLWLFDSRKR